MSTLKIAIEKIANHFPGLDTDYYYERLTAYSEGEWFAPNNTEFPDFQICFHLHECNVIQKANEPIWIDGSFRGHRILFRYTNNLDYSKSLKP